MFDELSLNILDIGMNSLAAGATELRITVIEDAKRDWLIIRIRDNGRGMDAKTLTRCLARILPQKRTEESHRTGAGLVAADSEMCDGVFDVKSAPGPGHLRHGLHAAFAYGSSPARRSQRDDVRAMRRTQE